MPSAQRLVDHGVAPPFALEAIARQMGSRLAEQAGAAWVKISVVSESSVKNWQVFDFESGKGALKSSSLPEIDVRNGDSLQIGIVILLA